MITEKGFFFHESTKSSMVKKICRGPLTSKKLFLGHEHENTNVVISR